MDLLHFGHYPYLEVDSKFVQTEYLYTDILCDCISEGSQDKDTSCYGTLNKSQDTDVCVLVDI